MSIPVIHDQDGHIDDLLTCLLLWLAPEIDLQAIGVGNGDCYIEQAFESVLKIATLLDLEGAEIAISDEPVLNPFPETWRRESFIVNQLPLFRANDLKKPYAQGRSRKSDVVFADCLDHSKVPLTVVATGPLTNITSLLQRQPQLHRKIREIIITGGAIKVPGNVEAAGQDGSAEWNIYADPVAFKFLLDTKIPIKLIPLDVTKQMPLRAAFLERLQIQAETRLASKLALKLWAIIKGFQTQLCDIASVAALVKPSLLHFQNMRIKVKLGGKNAGKTSRAFFSGRKIQVATKIDKSGFEELILSLLQLR
jgi:purine nucleosidase